jgi:uncharacterized membrane protein
LLPPLMVILKGRRHTCKRAPMLALASFSEGVLSVAFFFAAIYYAKLSASSRLNKAG